LCALRHKQTQRRLKKGDSN